MHFVQLPYASEIPVKYIDLSNEAIRRIVYHRGTFLDAFSTKKEPGVRLDKIPKRKHLKAEYY
jgi:hypothetical protein